MKLYKITRPIYTIKPGERESEDVKGATQFAGSQADARKARTELEAPFKAFKPKDRPEVKVIELDVPTDKKGLIEFLNELVG